MSYTAVVSGPVFESIDCMTQGEFAAWVAASPEREKGCELLNGRIVMTPPAGHPHGQIGARLGAILEAHVRARGLGRTFEKAIHERNGVRELWLVDTRGLRVTRFVLAAKGYDRGTVFEADGVIASTALSGLSVPLAGLFE